MSKEKTYCVWCGCEDDLELTLIPSTPVLEWMEEKINSIGRDKIWNENSDWSKVKMDSQVEAELLVYEELMSTITKKPICARCLKEDDALFAKYYENPEDDIFFDDDF